MAIPINWVRREENSWLAQEFNNQSVTPKRTTYSSKIEELASQTNKSGPQPLWEGYGDNNLFGPTRMPDAVRTEANTGDLYTALVASRKPDFVVEFGTAFGVSGMYFLSGLEQNNKGRLLTFEPNEVWAKMAKRNLSQISDRFNLTIGTFEENVGNCLPSDCCIDMAFIDAIHTKEFVIPQLEIVIANSRSKAIIILDDINFSDSMRDCWHDVSADERFSSTAALGHRVGILELKN